jgi:hypothetical protein
MSPARNLDLPRDVAGVAPAHRRCTRRNACLRRSAPMTPCVGGWGTTLLGDEGRRQQQHRCCRNQGPPCGSLCEFRTRCDSHSGPRRAERGRRYCQPAKALPGYQGQSPWLVRIEACGTPLLRR